jgi:hypothetical protein
LTGPPSSPGHGHSLVKAVLRDISQKAQRVKKIGFTRCVGADEENAFTAGGSDFSKIFPILQINFCYYHGVIVLNIIKSRFNLGFKIASLGLFIIYLLCLMCASLY